MGNDHGCDDGVRMMLEDDLAHGGVERCGRAADAGVGIDFDDLDTHARIIDARLQVRDESYPYSHREGRDNRASLHWWKE